MFVGLEQSNLLSQDRDIVLLLLSLRILTVTNVTAIVIDIAIG